MHQLNVLHAKDTYQVGQVVTGICFLTLLISYYLYIQVL
jgi:hypothetical protein